MTIITDKFPMHMLANPANVDITKEVIGSGDFERAVRQGCTVMVEDAMIEQFLFRHNALTNINDNNPVIKGHVGIGDTIIVIQEAQPITRPLYEESKYANNNTADGEDEPTTIPKNDSYSAFCFKIFKHA